MSDPQAYEACIVQAQKLVASVGAVVSGHPDVDQVRLVMQMGNLINGDQSGRVFARIAALAESLFTGAYDDKIDDWIVKSLPEILDDQVKFGRVMQLPGVPMSVGEYVEATYQEDRSRALCALGDTYALAVINTAVVLHREALR